MMKNKIWHGNISSDCIYRMDKKTDAAKRSLDSIRSHKNMPDVEVRFSETLGANALPRGRPKTRLGIPIACAQRINPKT